MTYPHLTHPTNRTAAARVLRHYRATIRHHRRALGPTATPHETEMHTAVMRLTQQQLVGGRTLLTRITDAIG